ncbi:MAG: bifunctional glutamate N-acetyltransferase/amino-acid acetyltransferase ArgJ [Actinobacteria bacterium]|uniref:Unannotated protein n=1 Tax=freshwater metagenome TaxID=449393 RepID=A0A6J5ZGH5_9ZZZZ|nr:bifunctional glutamate N-acetyltransferase/amino-acid acetyltransferase ArgJ [Actinomycetota bacterium]
MSVTFPRGFRASGVTAGLKASGNPDLALVVNDGPSFAAAAVFTQNRVQAAPVQWSKAAVKSGTFAAVLLNSGGANACTGPAGLADTQTSAEHLAQLLGIAAGEVAVCSTGLIGKRLPMDKLISGTTAAHESLGAAGGEDAAVAIMTTDTIAKTAQFAAASGWRIGGMAKGAGMLAPGLATMLVVITTDADVEAAQLDATLRDATRTTFDRIDSDGCMSTNDTVLLLSSGASSIKPDAQEFADAVATVCASLAEQLIGDAEGAMKDIKITVSGAATEEDAVQVARAVSRSNLFKCAIHGEDPNWGRVLAALGTTSAVFDPDQIDVDINQVAMCRGGAALDVEPVVDMADTQVDVDINLNAGTAQATLWTNDLTAMYVHENSVYST